LFSKMRVSWLALLVLVLFQTVALAAAGSNLPSDHPPLNVTPSITLTSPIGGESWERGSNHSIKWTYKGNIGTSVTLTLLKSMTPVATLVTSLPSGSNGVGSFSWTIDKNTAAWPDYRIQIQSDGGTVKTVGNTFAIVVGANELPTIQLTSPNGGEVWDKGLTYKITWKYTGTPGLPIKIMLVPQGDLASAVMIADNAPVGSGGYGSYSWKIPYSISRGADYTIWIGNGAVNKQFIDISEKPFTITELVK